MDWKEKQRKLAAANKAKSLSRTKQTIRKQKIETKKWEFHESREFVPGPVITATPYKDMRLRSITAKVAALMSAEKGK